jgi:transcriptional regulator with XRE-family HTH domain
MAKRTLLDWADLERELHAAGVPAEEIEAGARRLLARARGHQLAETRKQLGLGQKQIAAAMSVSVARVSQIEHGEVTSFEVIARYVEALGERLDLVADFGDRTVRLPEVVGLPPDDLVQQVRLGSAAQPATSTPSSAASGDGGIPPAPPRAFVRWPRRAPGALLHLPAAG